MKKETIITPEGYVKVCIKLIEGLGRTYGRWEVFSNFIEMLAIAISNQVDHSHFDEREERYLEIIKHYKKDEVHLFPEMVAYIIAAILQSSERPRDILGPMFHEMELQNEWKGQYFTSQYVCDLMAEITIVDTNGHLDKDYVTICEPTVGSGAMVLGFAKALKKRGYDYTSDMVASATDIDLRCVYMAYIQLSLYGIPAVVIHGNSLTLEEWSYWYTPAYIMDGWHQRCMNDSEQVGGSNQAS